MKFDALKDWWLFRANIQFLTCKHNLTQDQIQQFALTFQNAKCSTKLGWHNHIHRKPYHVRTFEQLVGHAKCRWIRLCGLGFSKTWKAQLAKLKCRLGTIFCLLCFAWAIGQSRRRHQNQQTAKCKVLAVETYYSLLSTGSCVLAIITLLQLGCCWSMNTNCYFIVYIEIGRWYASSTQ